MARDSDQERLKGLFGRLRDRLLDLSSRNPLVSYKHRPTSKRQLRFVDAVPDVVYARLVDEAVAIQILPLPEPDDVPMDERTAEFISHLQHAKSADTAYLTKIHELENAGADGDFELALAERELKDRVRAELGLPPRPTLRAINASHHAETLGIDSSFDLPQSTLTDAHEERALQTLKWPDALEAILEKIADEARLAEQEMGLSTLYLVFGFLEWFEADSSDKHYTAPLLLLPVKLEKKKTTGRKTIFNLSAAAEAPEVNLSLKKRIERDFNRLLPDFAADEDGHEAVQGYLVAVENAIEGQKRWRVRRQLTLGHFAFGRLAMYAELDPDRWEKHPVEVDLVKSVLSGSETGGGDGASPTFAPPEDYAIDDPEIERIAPHLIHDADASQHSALIDVVRGRNLVIQGPPGTGKSQTITNVIANVIGNGGTVLFLAEKQAALEVVKRRMDKARLGEFCLELHSDRAASRRVIESLKARHAIGYAPKGQTNGGVGPAWREGRREIADYLTALHRPLEGGATPFSAIWKALRARSREQLQLSRFGDVQLPEELLRDEAAQALLQSDLSLYSGMMLEYGKRFGMPGSSPWWAIEFGENVGAGNSGAILEELRSIRGLCDQLAARIQECAHWGATTSLQMARCVEAVDGLPDRPPTQPMLDALRGMDRSAIRSLIGTLEKLIALELQRGDFPRLDGADAALLLAIERVAELALTGEESKHTAAALMQAAEQSANGFGRVLDHLEALQPLLRTAGIESAARGDLVLALGLIAEQFSRVPIEWRAWALCLDDEKAKRFEQLFASWAELAEDEAGWRGRFPSFGNGAWPSPSELSHVAGLMRKSRLARLMGSLFGDRATIDGLAARLGVPTIALPAPAELEAMARHVQVLTAFEVNRMHRQFLGALWSGLDTPFEGLRRVNRDTLTLIGRVLPVEGGAALLKHLRKLDGSEFDSLVRQTGRLARLAQLPADLSALLASHSIEEIVEGKRRAEERIGQLVRADPARLLLPISIPVGQLEQARQVELKRRELSAHIQGHELSSLLSMLTAPGGIEGAKVAIEWFDAAEVGAASQGLQEILVQSVAEIGPVRSAASGYAEVEKQLRARLEHVTKHYGLRGLPCDDLATLSAQLDALLGFGTQLKELLELRDQRRRLAAAGIDHAVQRAEEVGVPPLDWCALVAGLIATAQAQNMRRTDAGLRRASGLRLEAQRKAFVEQDRRKIAHDRDTLRNAVRAVTPPKGTRSGSRKTWTEMQLIMNEFNKERKFVPVRDLIARAGKAMLAMKPCFMMSPLSLAKFLPPGSIEFDLLVIDEASQMRPEDALGGLLRVKQIVVVGDQKQLPPTDFFNRSGGDDTSGMVEEEDFEDVDDESILEACQKTFRAPRKIGPGHRLANQIW